MMHVYALFAAFCYIAGDFLAKMWDTSASRLLLVFALLAYFGGNIFFLFELKKHGLALATSVIPVATTVLGVLLAVFYFGERLTQQQMVGLVLAFVALLLLSVPLPFFKNA